MGINYSCHQMCCGQERNVCMHPVCLTMTTAWSNNLGSAGANSSNIILDGVNLGKFTQLAYQSSSPFGYVGGGTGFFYTTVYNTNQSASGEWFQFKAPFQMLLKSISFKNRNTRVTSAPKTVVLLERLGR
jgi:hypothetical protein